METSFVVVCYVVTFGSVAALAGVMMRRARALAAKLPPDDRPWA